MAATVGCVAGLLLFVFGVPVLLVAERAGPPFGLFVHLFAHSSSVLHSLGRPVTDSTIVHTFVLLAWLTWAWLVACVVTELVARLRGRAPWIIPASRHVQALVALLMGASVALLPSPKGYGPMRISAVHPGSQAQVTAFVSEMRPVAGNLPNLDTSFALTRVEPAHVASEESEAGVGRTYIVEPGDTLWSIADASSAPLFVGER